MTIIDCKNLNISFGAYEALKNVTLCAPAGSYISVVGTNGSGKTTFVKALLGLIKVTSGLVTLNATYIGYLPQSSVIKKNFPANIMEVVLSGAAARTLFFNKKIRAAATYWINALGLSEFSNKSYAELSGGQKQRVLLCRALLALNLPALDSNYVSSGASGNSDDNVSRLLVLDEPVTGLDTVVSDDLYSTLRTLNKTFSVTVVMVSHDVSRAVSNASHILHLERGSVLYFGPTANYKTTSSFYKMGRVEICHG